VEKSRILIGLVTALPVEWAALQLMIDNPVPVNVDGDPSGYWHGTIPSRVPERPHHIVAVSQVIDGNRSAAAVSTRLASSFPALRNVVMCGIAGGVPSGEHDIRLGDVVTSAKGIVDYDHVRSEAGGDRLRRSLDGLSKLMLDADRSLEGAERLGGTDWARALGRAERFRGFRSPPSTSSAPTVHRGAIGSADRLLRNAALRDRLATEFGLIAVEMEGAGIAVGSDLSGLHWYVVRGIADLADGAKNDLYHPYASLAAAAYVRSLLAQVAPPPNFTTGTAETGFASLIDALTPLLSDEQNRRTILRRLPARIGNQVPTRDTARVQAVALADTCERFPGGGQSLLEAVSSVAGDDPDFPAFADAMRRHWRGR
jgi:nucleoside phosphorylase